MRYNTEAILILYQLKGAERNGNIFHRLKINVYTVKHIACY